MKYEEFLREVLQRTKHRLKLMELGAGAVIFLAALVAFLTLGVILDHTLALPKLARWGILLTLDGAVALALLLAAVFVLRRLNDVFIARLIEKQNPDFRNTLIAYLEARRLPDVPAGIKDFIEEQATEKTLSIDPLLAVSPRRLVMASYALLATFLFFFFYSFFSAKSVLVALRRIWEPGADIPPATATQILSVEPGSRAVLAKSSVPLPVVVKLRGRLPKRVTLQWSREQELWGALELSPTKEGRQWETALTDLEHDLFYSIQAGDARSPVYHLHVVPTPLVTSLETHYRFPNYTGLSERVTYRGDVDALDGTLITVRAHTNTALAQAELLVNDVAIAAAIHQPQPGEEPGDTLEGSFTLSRSGSYSIRLTDPYGFTNPDPARYEIVCRYDQPPAVHLLEPQVSVRQPASQPLALTFEAKDDLGLASLQFRYKLPQENEERSESLPIPANVREVRNQLTVHLDRLGLQPGQALACYLQALDTFPDQPHVGRSETLVVAVPLPEELTEAHAQAPGPQAQQGEPTTTFAGVPTPATPTSTGAETPAAQGQEPQSQELTLENMVARDQAVIDTIRQALAEEAPAQTAAQPQAAAQAGQPEAGQGQGAASAQQANAGATNAPGAQPASTGQPAAGGQPGQMPPQAGGQQAPAGGAASPQAPASQGGAQGQPSSGQTGQTAQAGGQNQTSSQGSPAAQATGAGQSAGGGQPGQTPPQAAGQQASTGGAASAQAPGSQGGAGGAGATSSVESGEPLNPSQTLHPAGGSGGPGGGGGGGTSGTQAPELAVKAGASSPGGGQENLEAVGQVIDQLYDRLLRNDVDPKLLERLNWNLQDLAAWVVSYKAKLDQLAKEKGDAGVLLGEGLPGVPGPEQRVIEMGKSPLADRPTVGEGASSISPDEVARLLQGAKGTVSPEYRTLLEDYYKALADTARQ